MGVTGLWTVLQPSARPIKIDTLNKKRLAVDASIWIYQFLKAVRDKEGNALRNSHVVGFFRRICKLLFYGIKPVFVFDGGAPALKRQTITARKRRREGRREDAVKTAGKLLAVQVQRKAEEENERRKQAREQHVHNAEEETLPDELVYVDEIQMTPQERKQNREFKKKDQYHLPELESSLDNMGAPDDPRIMSHEELEAYARQFHSGEDINLYDFSKIDFDSPFFLSLPASDRYNILNAARLRSRLRMGYSKEQLDTMFPDRMAFSRFQIDRVKERNELTQRLMNINGMNGEDGMLIANGGARIAGEKGREYVLVKNDAVEGGWALGVVSGSNEGDRNKPIDVDRVTRPAKTEDIDDSEDEVDFEDVPIEGLNRLPKLGDGSRLENNALAERRRNLYASRKKDAGLVEDNDDEFAMEPDTLFVGEDKVGRLAPNEPLINGDALFEGDTLAADDEDNDDLRRAIEMSLESSKPEPDEQSGTRALSSINEAGAGNSGNRGPFDDESDDDEDFQAALAKSRQLYENSRKQTLEAGPSGQHQGATTTSARTDVKHARISAFDGPLPFEKLNLGGPVEEAADEGGFEKDASREKSPEARPLPPWFMQDVRTNLDAQKMLEEQDRSATLRHDEQHQHGVLRKQHTNEVIDLDVSDEEDTVSRPGATRQTADFIDVDALDNGDSTAVMTTSVEIVLSSETSSQDISVASPTIPSVAVPTPEPSSPAIDDLSKTQPTVERDGQGTQSALERTSPFEQSNISEHGPPEQSKSPSPVFEDVLPVNISSSNSLPPATDLPHESSSMQLLEAAEELNEVKDENEANDYSDPEDDQLFQQLAAEAEEHARFASSLNHKSQLQNQEDYERELRALRNQQKKDRRDADEVNHVMIMECQQLLKLFGIPYITAPMEAEAQCAELVRLGLVDGIVTDDSDCFLFGGTRVYKNMFNQAKYVECYLAQDLEKEFGLDRTKLIRFAHLLGSDYTDGIPGVGPVTAIEILSEFNSDTGLEDFKNWWQGVQMGVQNSEETGFRKKFRRNATRFFLPSRFPSEAVTEAYLHPEVDSTREPFQWGVPDLDAIRGFLMSTIGWTKERTDEVLGPVIRDMNRRAQEGTQSNMTAFFTGTTGAGAFAPRRIGGGTDRGGGLLSTLGVPGRKPASKRMAGALGRLKEGAARSKRKRGPADVDDDDDDIGTVPQRQEQQDRDPEKDPNRELEDPKDANPQADVPLDPDATVVRTGNAGRGRGGARVGGRAKNAVSLSTSSEQPSKKKTRPRKGRKTT